MLKKFEYKETGFFTGGLLDKEIGVSFDFECDGINCLSLLDRVYHAYKKNNATQEIIPWGNTSDHIRFIPFKELGLNYKFIRNEEGKKYLYPRSKDYSLVEVQEILSKKEDRIYEIVDTEILNFATATFQDVEAFIDFLVIKKELNVLLKQKAIHSAFCNPLRNGGIDYNTRKVKKQFIVDAKEIEIYAIDESYNKFN